MAGAGMDWLRRFPAMGADALSALRRTIDEAFRGFTREHGAALEQVFLPLREFLLFSERLLNSSPTWFVGNVAGAFFDFRHGLLPWSPFLLLLIVGAVAGWRKAPPWARSLAVGGLLYLLIQLRANRFSGGDGHFAYRYPLETLMAAGPLFVSGYSTWIRQRPVVRWALYLSISASVLFQGIGAYYT